MKRKKKKNERTRRFLARDHQLRCYWTSFWLNRKCKRMTDDSRKQAKQKSEHKILPPVSIDRTMQELELELDEMIKFTLASPESTNPPITFSFERAGKSIFYRRPITCLLFDSGRLWDIARKVWLRKNSRVHLTATLQSYFRSNAIFSWKFVSLLSVRIRWTKSTGISFAAARFSLTFLALQTHRTRSLGQIIEFYLPDLVGKMLWIKTNK